MWISHQLYVYVVSCLILKNTYYSNIKFHFLNVKQLTHHPFYCQVKCNELPEAIAFKQKLEECNKRVRAKKKTRETCEEELHDWIRFVDHCIAKDLFSYLK